MKEMRALALTAVMAVSTLAGAQQNFNPPDPDYLTREQVHQAALDRAQNCLRPAELYQFRDLMQYSNYAVTQSLSHALASNYWHAYQIGQEKQRKEIQTQVVVRFPLESMRPMRLIMAAPADLRSDKVLPALLSGLGPYEKTQLKDWWLSKATQGEKDVVTKIVKQNALMANRFYPSLAVW